MPLPESMPTANTSVNPQETNQLNLLEAPTIIEAHAAEIEAREFKAQVAIAAEALGNRIIKAEETPEEIIERGLLLHLANVQKPNPQYETLMQQNPELQTLLLKSDEKGIPQRDTSRFSTTLLADVIRSAEQAKTDIIEAPIAHISQIRRKVQVATGSALTDGIESVIKAREIFNRQIEDATRGVLPTPTTERTDDKQRAREEQFIQEKNRAKEAKRVKDEATTAFRYDQAIGLLTQPNLRIPVTGKDGQVDFVPLQITDDVKSALKTYLSPTFNQNGGKPYGDDAKALVQLDMLMGTLKTNYPGLAPQIQSQITNIKSRELPDEAKPTTVQDVVAGEEKTELPNGTQVSRREKKAEPTVKETTVGDVAEDTIHSLEAEGLIFKPLQQEALKSAIKEGRDITRLLDAFSLDRRFNDAQKANAKRILDQYADRARRIEATKPSEKTVESDITSKTKEDKTTPATPTEEPQTDKTEEESDNIEQSRIARAAEILGVRESRINTPARRAAAVALAEQNHDDESFNSLIEAFVEPGSSDFQRAAIRDGIKSHIEESKKREQEVIEGLKIREILGLPADAQLSYDQINAAIEYADRTPKDLKKLGELYTRILGRELNESKQGETARENLRLNLNETLAKKPVASEQPADGTTIGSGEAQTQEGFTKKQKEILEDYTNVLTVTTGITPQQFEDLVSNKDLKTTNELKAAIGALKLQSSGTDYTFGIADAVINARAEIAAFAPAHPATPSNQPTSELQPSVELSNEDKEKFEALGINTQNISAAQLDAVNRLIEGKSDSIIERQELREIAAGRKLERDDLSAMVTAERSYREKAIAKAEQAAKLAVNGGNNVPSEPTGEGNAPAQVEATRRPVEIDQEKFYEAVKTLELDIDTIDTSEKALAVINLLNVRDVEQFNREFDKIFPETYTGEYATPERQRLQEKLVNSIVSYQANLSRAQATATNEPAGSPAQNEAIDEDELNHALLVLGEIKQTINTPEKQRAAIELARGVGNRERFEELVGVLAEGSLVPERVKSYGESLLTRLVDNDPLYNVIPERKQAIARDIQIIVTEFKADKKQLEVLLRQETLLSDQDITGMLPSNVTLDTKQLNDIKSTLFKIRMELGTQQKANETEIRRLGILLRNDDIAPELNIEKFKELALQDDLTFAEIRSFVSKIGNLPKDKLDYVGTIITRDVSRFREMTGQSAPTFQPKIDTIPHVFQNPGGKGHTKVKITHTPVALKETVTEQLDRLNPQDRGTALIGIATELGIEVELGETGIADDEKLQALQDLLDTDHFQDLVDAENLTVDPANRLSRLDVLNKKLDILLADTPDLNKFEVYRRIQYVNRELIGAETAEIWKKSHAEINPTAELPGTPEGNAQVEQGRTRRLVGAFRRKSAEALSTVAAKAQNVRVVRNLVEAYKGIDWVGLNNIGRKPPYYPAAPQPNNNPTPPQGGGSGSGGIPPTNDGTGNNGGGSALSGRGLSDRGNGNITSSDGNGFSLRQSNNDQFERDREAFEQSLLGINTGVNPAPQPPTRDEFRTNQTGSQESTETEGNEAIPEWLKPTPTGRPAWLDEPQEVAEQAIQVPRGIFDGRDAQTGAGVARVLGSSTTMDDIAALQARVAEQADRDARALEEITKADSTALYRAAQLSGEEKLERIDQIDRALNAAYEVGGQAEVNRKYAANQVYTQLTGKEWKYQPITVVDQTSGERTEYPAQEAEPDSAPELPAWLTDEVGAKDEPTTQNDPSKPTWLDKLKELENQRDSPTNAPAGKYDPAAFEAAGQALAEKEKSNTPEPSPEEIVNEVNLLNRNLANLEREFGADPEKVSASLQRFTELTGESWNREFDMNAFREKVEDQKKKLTQTNQDKDLNLNSSLEEVGEGQEEVGEVEIVLEEEELANLEAKKNAEVDQIIGIYSLNSAVRNELAKLIDPRNITQYSQTEINKYIRTNISDNGVGSNIYFEVLNRRELLYQNYIGKKVLDSTIPSQVDLLKEVPEKGKGALAKLLDPRERMMNSFDVMVAKEATVLGVGGDGVKRQALKTKIEDLRKENAARYKGEFKPAAQIVPEVQRFAPNPGRLTLEMAEAAGNSQGEKDIKAGFIEILEAEAATPEVQAAIDMSLKRLTLEFEEINLIRLTDAQKQELKSIADPRNLRNTTDDQRLDFARRLLNITPQSADDSRAKAIASSIGSYAIDLYATNFGNRVVNKIVESQLRDPAFTKLANQRTGLAFYLKSNIDAANQSIETIIRGIRDKSDNKALALITKDERERIKDQLVKLINKNKQRRIGQLDVIGQRIVNGTNGSAGDTIRLDPQDLNNIPAQAPIDREAVGEEESNSKKTNKRIEASTDIEAAIESGDEGEITRLIKAEPQLIADYVLRTFYILKGETPDGKTISFKKEDGDAKKSQLENYFRKVAGVPFTPDLDIDRVISSLTPPQIQTEVVGSRKDKMLSEDWIEQAFSIGLDLELSEALESGNSEVVRAFRLRYPEVAITNAQDIHSKLLQREKLSGAEIDKLNRDFLNLTGSSWTEKINMSGLENDIRGDAEDVKILYTAPTTNEFLSDEEKQRNYVEATREIYEKAGNRSLEESIQLVRSARAIVEAQELAGRGKIKATIQEMAGTKELIHDGGIVYIPEADGDLIVIGDLHGDHLTLENILNETQFITNMEKGDRTRKLVLMGDLNDRGEYDVQVNEVVNALITRYPNNVILIGADHEKEFGKILPQDFPLRLIQHYPEAEEELIEKLPPSGQALYQVVKTFDSRTVAQQNAFIEDLGEWAKEIIESAGIEQYFFMKYQSTFAEVSIMAEYLKLYKALPSFVACGNGLAISHGGIPREFDNKNLVSLKNDQSSFQDMMWSDPSLTPLVGHIAKNRRGSGVKFDEEAFNRFMNRIGASSMVTGHRNTMFKTDSRQYVDVQLIFNNRFTTTHSTGAGSPVSAYDTKEQRPAYNYFRLDQRVDRITRDNIVPVKW